MSKTIVTAEQITTDHYLEEIDGSTVGVIQTLTLTDGRILVKWSDGETNLYQAWVSLYMLKDAE